MAKRGAFFEVLADMVILVRGLGSACSTMMVKLQNL